MSDINIMVMGGRLTRDPELRRMASGGPVCEFDLASNYKSSKAKRETFLRVVVFGKFGEVLNENLRKGSPVVCAGRYQEDTWEKDGETKRRGKLIANEVHFGGRAAAASDVPEIEVNDDDIPF